jgi:hypothetical protein
MPAILTLSTGKPARPSDQGLLVVSLGFSDHNSAATTPATAAWSLTDEHGNVINERLDVAISPLAAAVDIPLQGDDLKYSDGAKRVFTVEYTYTSDLGTLTDRGQCEFAIENLVKAKTEA